MLITQDCDAPRSDRLCYIGMDNYAAGRLAGQLVKEALPDGGSVMIFVGRLEQVNARLRRQGVIDELLDRPPDPTPLRQAGGDVIGRQVRDPGHADRSVRSRQGQGASRRRDRQVSGPGLHGRPVRLQSAAVPGRRSRRPASWTRSASWASTKRKPRCRASPTAKIYGTVVQNPYEYGRKSVEILTALVRGDRSVIPPASYIDIPARQIRRDNVQAFWDDLKAKMRSGQRRP